MGPHHRLPGLLAGCWYRRSLALLTGTRPWLHPVRSQPRLFGNTQHTWPRYRSHQLRLLSTSQAHLVLGAAEAHPISFYAIGHAAWVAPTATGARLLSSFSGSSRDQSSAAPGRGPHEAGSGDKQPGFSPTLRAPPPPPQPAPFDSGSGTMQRLYRARGRAGRLKERLKDRINMKENILTIPNVLSGLRIAAAPIIGYSITHSNPDLAWWLFVYAGASDWLDGIIARQFPSQKTLFGGVLDPMADKVLTLSCAASLGVAGLMPMWLCGLMLFKDVTMLGATFYLRYTSLKAMQSTPVTAGDYFDFARPSVIVRPNLLAKGNTALQFLLFGYLIAANAGVVAAIPAPYDHYTWYVIGATTLSTGLTYLFSSEAIEFLGANSDKKIARRAQQIEAKKNEVRSKVLESSTRATAAAREALRPRAGDSRSAEPLSRASPSPAGPRRLSARVRASLLTKTDALYKRLRKKSKGRAD